MVSTSDAAAQDHGPPRIQPVVEPTAEQQALLDKTLLRGGRPLNVFTTLAHHPRLLRRFNSLGGMFMTGELPPRDREVVILRVAVVTGSDYEFAQHVLMGREAGLEDAAIDRLARRDMAGWSPQDRLLLQVTDELLEHDVVSAETWAAVEQRFTVPQILELLFLPGFYRMLAGVLRTVGVEIEEGLPSEPRPRRGN